ncbi:uncharacterized protein TNCV_1744951 [Trichonephila clavipes]|nr:uncharacterized protein TNCV_1744951 [Trichonephila clavipes]
MLNNIVDERKLHEVKALKKIEQEDKYQANQKAFELEKLKLQAQNPPASVDNSPQMDSSPMRLDLKVVLPTFIPDKDDIHWSQKVKVAAVGWMEMGLSQADVARRLNVSRSVVQRLWDLPIICVQKTCSRPTTSYNTCRRPFSSSFGTKEKNHYCAACRPLASGKKIFHNAGLYARRPVVCVPSTDDKNAYAGQRTCFLTQQQWASVLFPDLQWRVIQGVY